MKKDINIGIITPYVDGYYHYTIIDSIYNECKNKRIRVFVFNIWRLISTNSYNYFNLGNNIIDGWILLPIWSKIDILNILNISDKPAISISSKLNTDKNSLAKSTG